MGLNAEGEDGEIVIEGVCWGEGEDVCEEVIHAGGMGAGGHIGGEGGEGPGGAVWEGDFVYAVGVDVEVAWGGEGEGVGVVGGVREDTDHGAWGAEEEGLGVGAIWDEEGWGVAAAGVGQGAGLGVEDAVPDCEIGTVIAGWEGAIEGGEDGIWACEIGIGEGAGAEGEEDTG